MYLSIQNFSTELWTQGSIEEFLTFNFSLVQWKLDLADTDLADTNLAENLHLKDTLLKIWVNIFCF